MELGTIEREIYIDATPDVVFEVISDPEHVKHWWPDQARYEVVVGSAGEIVFGDPAAGGKVVSLTVVTVDRPNTFAFRWTHPAEAVATTANSLLVTFDLEPQDDGTLLRFSETGFRELGWEAAVLEELYNDHVRGWDTFLPKLTSYIATVKAH